jgi:hypothetical protein
MIKTGVAPFHGVVHTRRQPGWHHFFHAPYPSRPHAVRRMPPPDAQAKHGSNIRIMGLTPATWTEADSDLFLES